MQMGSSPIENMDNIKQAQTEMGNNYKDGATGVVVSGLIWLISSFGAYNYTPKQAVWTLLIGVRLFILSA